MSEYAYVEKPFLDQLAALGWKVVDQGYSKIPSDPSKSFRTSFRDVLLKAEFKRSVKSINVLDDGTQWLSDAQLEELYNDLVSVDGRSLLERNENGLSLLFKHAVHRNEVTGEESPVVTIIDFAQPLKNSFIAINQFRIDTPGRVKNFIVPDIVLFVNGLPLVLVECKDDVSREARGENRSVDDCDPLYEAMKQFWRYSNQRDETREAGLEEGDERLFHFNQLVIVSTGELAKVGTISSTTEEFFYEWKEIFPERYREFKAPLGKVRSQETLVQGTLARKTLLDIVRNFTVFKENKKSKRRSKVVCRYPQYRAVTKIVDRLRTGKTPIDRSGVVWHTQGSGKSLSMVFLIKKLRTSNDLKDYKILLVNDRTDLEDQLGETASLSGETVYYIESSKSLKEELKDDRSNLNMVMVHKFRENDGKALPGYVAEAMQKYGDKPLPEFREFGVVNTSERILILVDEAHRTQGGDLGDNLFSAFTGATRIAFTGTPLIKDEEHKTRERFGDYIDKYRLHDAVKDGATLQIVYEGRTADAAIYQKAEFDRKFDDLCGNLSADQILAIKKKYGTLGDIEEAESRIEEIARDIVRHYIDNILPNGFKAQVVCSSKLATVHYETYLNKALIARIAEEESAREPNNDLIRRLKFLKTAVVVSADETNEKAVITTARKRGKEMNAVENFLKSFDFPKENDSEAKQKELTGIAFLIVCDMLLTGFDAEIEQVMYLDKKVKDHNLLQTIARVNRVALGKKRGYIVDYIGVTNHLEEALRVYSKEDLNEILSAFRDVGLEIPVMEERYQRLVHHFVEGGILRIEEFVMQRIKEQGDNHAVLEECLVKLGDLRFRSDFEVYFKAFLESMDIVLPGPAAQPFKIPMKRFGYILERTKQRYRDESISVKGIGEKVRALVSEHLISLGIDPKIPPVELFSDAFERQVSKSETARAKASEMEHAIRKHCKVHMQEDPVLYARFSEKLETLLKKYRDSWEQLSLELNGLRTEMAQGRAKQSADGLDAREARFLDLICLLAFKTPDIPPTHKEDAKKLIEGIVDKFQQTLGIVNFWGNEAEVQRLRGELSNLMLFSGVDEIISARESIVSEVLQLAERRHKDFVK